MLCGRSILCYMVNMKTKVNNVDVMESKDGEEIAKEEIESAFGIEMPTFFYMPGWYEVSRSNTVVTDAQMATHSDIRMENKTYVYSIFKFERSCKYNAKDGKKVRRNR